MQYIQYNTIHNNIENLEKLKTKTYAIRNEMYGNWVFKRVLLLLFLAPFNLRKIHQITRCNRIIVEFTMHCKSKCPIKTFHFTIFQMIAFDFIYIGTMVIQLNIYFSKYVQEYTSSLLHRVIIPFQKDRRIRNFRTLPPRKTQLLEERVLNYSWICYIA